MVLVSSHCSLCPRIALIDAFAGSILVLLVYLACAQLMLCLVRTRGLLSLVVLDAVSLGRLYKLRYLCLWSILFVALSRTWPALVHGLGASRESGLSSIVAQLSV